MGKATCENTIYNSKQLVKNEVHFNRIWIVNC